MPQRYHVLYAVRTNNLWHLLKESAWEWFGVILLGLAAVAIEFVPVYERVAFASDITIAYPHKEQTVPTYLLVILAVAVPIVVILLVSLAYRRSVFDLHMSLLGLFVSLGFTLVFTQVVKVTTGRLRPDFLARCQPSLVENDPLMRVERCTGNPGDIKEGRKSFFSGHSSIAWAGLGFLSLYLSRHLNFHRKPLTIKYIITVLPVILAYLISISRVDNYWHHWQDVFTGAIVGSIVAIYNYRYHCSSFEEIVPEQFEGAAPQTDVLAHGRRSSERHYDNVSSDGSRMMSMDEGGSSTALTDGRLGRSEETWIPMTGQANGGVTAYR